jgi:hypothetical protein
VQWTRLPAGETGAEFVKRIQQLLSGEPGHALIGARRPALAPGGPSRWGLWVALVAVLAAVATAYLLVERSRTAKPTSAAGRTTHAETPIAFTPPPHSLAVLPFVNMSGDPSQEYFSDGLTEELLNSLTRINELHVAATTSAFSFEGKHADIDTIARKLNVAQFLRAACGDRRTPCVLLPSSSMPSPGFTYGRRRMIAL